ncbi:MAG: MipA/OmpV family protein, partial [Pseudomonadota bacterium]
MGRRTRHLIRNALSAVVLVCGAMGAQAQTPEGWSIGLIGVGSTSPYVGEETTGQILPFLSYRTEQFAVGLDGASYTFLDTGGTEASAILRPRFAGIDDDVAELAGIDRDLTLDFGLGLGFDAAPGLRFKGYAVQEITGQHQGQEISLRVEHQVAGLPLAVYAGADWQSAELTEYLFGVRPGEAIAGRPAYAPGAAVTPFIGVRGFLPLSDRSALVGGIEVRQFGDAITDSPIVDEDGTISA